MLVIYHWIKTTITLSIIVAFPPNFPEYVITHIAANACASKVMLLYNITNLKTYYIFLLFILLWSIGHPHSLRFQLRLCFSFIITTFIAVQMHSGRAPRIGKQTSKTTGIRTQSNEVERLMRNHHDQCTCGAAATDGCHRRCGGVGFDF